MLRGTRLAGLLAIVLSLQACSLLTIKEPGKPLSSRQLDTRLLTREYAESFQKRVELAANDISGQNTDPDTRLLALRWKIQAAAAARHAATQVAPDMALLDSWALAAQQREFFVSGSGARLFGAQQDIARNTAVELEQRIVGIARGVSTPAEFASYERFVADYVHDDPVNDVHFIRVSVVDRWTAQGGHKTSLIDTVGTVPQVMSDFADRVRLYGDQLPEETLWQTQLALREAGYSSASWQQEMERMNASLDDVGRFAQASPELLRHSIADLRGSLYSTADRFDRSWQEMARTLRGEREELTRSVEQESQSVALTVDQQRAALAADAHRIAAQTAQSVGDQLRRLLRELAVLALVAVLVILGLPFVAGYYLGQFRARARFFPDPGADQHPRPR